MKKIFFLSSLVCNALLFAQTTPMITKWRTTDANDRQIAINNRGTATITYEQVGNSSNKGSGVLKDNSKTTIDLPSSGEYIVTITPTSPFTLYMYGTTQAEALELKEIQQWGSFATGTTASNMFTNCKELKITATDIPNFSTITDMANMFFGCSAITDIPNINQWDVSNVTDMTNMFNSATNFNANISNWNTSNVVLMPRMFSNPASAPGAFNQDISNWDTSKVRDMNAMFRRAKNFNQNLSKWNTENVTNFDNMFFEAVSFNQNLGTFNLKSARTAAAMLNFSGLSCENYSRTLQGWANNNATNSGITFGAIGLRYGNEGNTFRNTLVSTKRWTISGDTLDTTCVTNLSTNEINAKNKINIENPVRDILKIRTKNIIKSGEIFDMNGRLIKTINSNETNVSDLQKGIYILKINFGGETSTVKLMKL